LAIRAGFGFRFSLDSLMARFSDEALFTFPENDFAAGIDMIYYPQEAIARVNFGGEKFWQLNKYHSVGLRLGYKFISELGLVSGLTLGAGYKLTIDKQTNIELDYSLNPYGDLGEAHRISMTGKFLGPAETHMRVDKAEAMRYYKEGYDLLYNKDYPAAILKFSEAIKRNRDLTQAYMGMGAAFLRIGKPDLAKKAYGLALEKDPGNEKLKQFIDSYRWEFNNAR
ncbi:MAG TPA: hypothetical protein P5511_08090, partial [Candidatus Goldiibacteriota bacterium]|nr:hypothetical protein [Candidatus Goldiibacteriota bacterium]